VGRASKPGKAMLFCSVLYNIEAPVDQVIHTLTREFGETILSTEPMEFTYTDYYHQEMGKHLYRVILAFSNLVERDALPDIKTHTNEIENTYLKEGRRQINLDPGLMTLENICLATTKPYSHRMYLRKGIWAEITLIYTGNSYRKLEWTYPDYASDELVSLFNRLREDYKRRVQCLQA